MTKMELKLAKANGLYDDLVGVEINKRIRKKYTVSQEFSILRQRDTKPEEFEAYNAYVEQCKAEVKAEFEAETEEIS